MIDKAVSPPIISLLLGGFATFAVVLAMPGIFGVISSSVNQRSQEIGIRMALGESARRLQLRILLQTLALAAVGIVVGCSASWAMARTLSGFLFGVSSSDPATFPGVVAVLPSDLNLSRPTRAIVPSNTDRIWASVSPRRHEP